MSGLAEAAPNPEPGGVGVNACVHSAPPGEGTPPSRPFVLVHMGGDDDNPTLALLDDGAELEAIVSADECARHGVQVRSAGDGDPPLRAFGGARAPVVGRAVVPLAAVAVDATGRRHAVHLPPAQAYVVRTEMAPYRLLLGARYLRAHAPCRDLAEGWWRVTDVHTDGIELRVPLVAPVAAAAPTAAPTIHVVDDDGNDEVAALVAIALDDHDDVTAAESGAPHTHTRNSWATALRERTHDEMCAVVHHWTAAARRADDRQRVRALRALRKDTRAPGAPVAALSDEQQFLDDAERREQARHEAELADNAHAELERCRERINAWAGQLIGTLTAAHGAELGEAPLVLNDEQKRVLISSLHELAPSLTDPRVRPRTGPALPVRVVLDVDPAAKPTQDGFRRVLGHERQQAASVELDTLLTGRLVEVARDPRWVHAVVLVRKKDGRWRFAIDYRPLNAALRPQHYPLPDTDELLRELARHRWFSTYDLKDAFYHLELEPHQRALTAFHVPGRGTYQWRVLPMGVQPATAAWQANMEAIFGPLIGRGVLVFADDLVVYGDDEGELVGRMRMVHALLARHDLRVAPAKMQLFRRQVSFLGRTVRHGTIGVDERHSRALREYARPRTVLELQRFVGLVNYCREFAPGLATHLAELGRIEKAARVAAPTAATSRCALAWDGASARAFDAITKQLGSPTTLTMPDMSRLHQRIRVETDAATEANLTRGGLGAGIFWRDDDGAWRLVAAWSRILKPAERKYAAAEVELLAAVEVVRRYDWLFRRATGVHLLTDHQALTYLTKMADAAHGRLARWAATLLSYDITVVYRRGADNVFADALSRAHANDESTHVRDVLAPTPASGPHDAHCVAEIGAPPNDTPPAAAPTTRRVMTLDATDGPHARATTRAAVELYQDRRWSECVRAAHTQDDANADALRLLARHRYVAMRLHTTVRTLQEAAPARDSVRGQLLVWKPQHTVTDAPMSTRTWTQLPGGTIVALGVIGDGERLLVANEARRPGVVRYFHTVDAGHLGVHKTATRLRTGGFTWPGWREDVARTVAECEICQQRKGAVQKRHVEGGRRIDCPTAFNEHVHIDHVGPLRDAGGQPTWILSMTDAHTRWTEAAVVDTVDALATARHIHALWVARFGAPRFMTSDRGAAFVNEVVGGMLHTLGVEHVRTTPAHPQANGLEERTHATLKNVMAMVLHDRAEPTAEWAATLPTALWVLRATRHRVTGMSPARALYGWDLPALDAHWAGPTARRLRDDGVLVLASVDDGDRGALRAAYAQRDAQLADAHEQLLARLEPTLRQVAGEDDGGADDDGTADGRDDDGGDEQRVAQLQAANAAYPQLAPGVFVRVALGAPTGDAADVPALAPRWTAEVWRVLRMTRAVTAVLTRVDDPLTVRVVSAMHVKPVTLPDAERARAEQLFDEVAKAGGTRLWRGLGWVRAHDDGDGGGDERSDDAPRWPITRAVQERGRGNARQLLVMWDDPGRTRTWEPYARIAEDAPVVVQQWEERRESSRARRNSVPRRRRKK